MKLTPEYQATVNRVTSCLLRRALELQLHKEFGQTPGIHAVISQAIADECKRLDTEATLLEAQSILSSLNRGT